MTNANLDLPITFFFVILLRIEDFITEVANVFHFGRDLCLHFTLQISRFIGIDKFDGNFESFVVQIDNFFKWSFQSTFGKCILVRSGALLHFNKQRSGCWVGCWLSWKEDLLEDHRLKMSFALSLQCVYTLYWAPNSTISRRVINECTKQ